MSPQALGKPRPMLTKRFSAHQPALADSTHTTTMQQDDTPDVHDWYDTMHEDLWGDLQSSPDHGTNNPHMVPNYTQATLAQPYDNDQTNDHHASVVGGHTGVCDVGVVTHGLVGVTQRRYDLVRGISGGGGTMQDGYGVCGGELTQAGIRGMLQRAVQQAQTAAAVAAAEPAAKQVATQQAHGVRRVSMGAQAQSIKGVGCVGVWVSSGSDTVHAQSPTEREDGLQGSGCVAMGTSSGSDATHCTAGLCNTATQAGAAIQQAACPTQCMGGGKGEEVSTVCGKRAEHPTQSPQDSCKAQRAAAVPAPWWFERRCVYVECDVMPSDE